MKKLLSRKRKAWVEQRTAPTIKGSVLANPASVEDKHAKAVAKLVRQMKALTEKELKKLYSTPDAKAYFTTDSAPLMNMDDLSFKMNDLIFHTQMNMEMDTTDASIASQARILINALTAKFDSMFGDVAGILSERMVNGVNKESKTSLAGSMKQLSGGLTVKTNLMSADLHETVKASIAQNVLMIKSIPEEYMKRVGGAVLRSVTTGQGMADLMPQIQKYGDMTERKAKNIALDQTRKAYNTINADRMKKVGVKQFEWIHSAGGIHPRRDHIEMSGNIYSFDDLPVIDQNTGERGIPGQAINCRCTMRPVIVFDEE